MSFHDSIVDVKISERQIRTRVREMGAEITRDYTGKSLTLVTVLKGSIIFCADLVRVIDLPLRIDFLGLTSYGGQTESTGVVRITSDLSHPVEGQHVLVVEDIVDTGLTMSFLIDHLKADRPASLKVAALLEKPARAVKKTKIHYKGFVIDDFFAVGYGLDYDERYRNLPFIGVLRNGGR